MRGGSRYRSQARRAGHSSILVHCPRSAMPNSIQRPYGPTGRIERGGDGDRSAAALGLRDFGRPVPGALPQAGRTAGLLGRNRSDGTGVPSKVWQRRDQRPVVRIPAALLCFPAAALLPSTLLAQTSTSQTELFRTTEFDIPSSTGGLLLLAGGLVAIFGLAIRTSLRDSRFLAAGWRAALLVPRLLVLLLVLVILINPRQRTQTTQIQKSRVGVLLDTSLSMAYAMTDEDADEAVADAETRRTRAETFQSEVVDAGLLKQLSGTHAVSVYTFDSALTGPQAVISDGDVAFADPKSDHANDDIAGSADSDAGARVSLNNSSDTPTDAHQRWNSIVQPRGAETRLGEALHELIGQMSGRTLSGIVVFSDGRNNTGLDTDVARLRAERSETRIITVGLGGVRPQINVWIAGMQSPSDVHKGDPFDISVIVQGNGAAGGQGTVTLFQQSAGSDGKDQQEVAKQPFEVPEDGLPAEITFSQTLAVPGNYEYVARVALLDEAVTELTVDDNERRREVEVTDRKLKVLLISSGPMREYRFVRNTLFRHSGIDSDVWLQTVTEENLGMVSQEATKLLTEFPQTEAELFEYDVIVAFDPDWSRVSPEQQKFLNRWVSEHSGGLVVVAGEIFTPELAADTEKFREIAVLYPVLLNRMLSELKVTQRADEPWPVLLTPEGRTSEFLQIADAEGNASVDLWQTFAGIYRSYPVRGVRDGAVVLARYGNPRARTEDGQPPLLASQFYGSGRTMFVGSAETWRLRGISPEGHQRFWTSLIREVGQGRRRRGRSRGLLLLDRTEVTPGQPVTIRAQLYDSRMRPLQTETVPVSIVDAGGRSIPVPDSLRGDTRRPGQFVSVFRPSRQGSFRVTVPVPESSDVLQANIEVVLPNLESEDPSQNVALLTNLAQGTGGGYLNFDKLSEQLSRLLPDRSEPIVVDEQLTTLWDRRWLMFLMIALLSFEWALRRVVRLS